MHHDSDQILTSGSTFQNCTWGHPEIPDATWFLRLLIGVVIASNTQKSNQSMSTYGNWHPTGDLIADNKTSRESLVLTMVSQQTVTQKLCQFNNIIIIVNLCYYNITILQYDLVIGPNISCRVCQWKEKSSFLTVLSFISVKGKNHQKFAKVN